MAGLALAEQVAIVPVDPGFIVARSQGDVGPPAVV
jgi:hypothetical protein